MLICRSPACSLSLSILFGDSLFQLDVLSFSLLLTAAFLRVRLAQPFSRSQASFRSRYLRDISLVARWLSQWNHAEASFYGVLTAWRGCRGLGPLPPQRSYCFSQPQTSEAFATTLRHTVPWVSSFLLLARTLSLLFSSSPPTPTSPLTSLPSHPHSPLSPLTSSLSPSSARTVLRILMDRLRNCWQN